LKDLALSEDLALEELERLNPELKTGVTPRQPEGYDLKVPVGLAESARLAFAAAPTAPLPGPRRHTVHKGETLASVARRYKVPVSRLAEANGLSSKSKISRGEVLVIPGRAPSAVAAKSAPKSASKPAASASPDAKVASVSAKRPAKGPSKSPTRTATRSYRVRGGDTLSSIARRTGTTVDSLIAANDLASPEKIKPGDKLVIPARAR
jgi:membrane-bound lytic murein transglycosylase D